MKLYSFGDSFTQGCCQDNPNLFVKVGKENIKAKIKGMESYEFEKRKYPHPRSPEALEIRAAMWGISIGTDYAEAFNIIRHYIKI